MKFTFNVEMEYEMSFDEFKEQLLASMRVLNSLGISDQFLTACGVDLSDMPKMITELVTKNLVKLDDSNKIVRVTNCIVE